jgi:hypothetical protein
MTDPALKDLTRIGHLARALACAALIYWALFALLAPVTVWDAQVYNLARLPLAELGGLWGNSFWTSERQVTFPLAFDVIHLPLLHVGVGFALPSFLCFLGTLGVAWCALGRWHGPDAAWLGVLVLLAMPTLAFQAVATKNDLAVLFGLAVWFHALGNWRREPRSRHLVFAAVAIGFMAGAKSSGIILAFLAILASVWILRQARAPLASFATYLLVSLLALGSIETYVVAYRTYGHPLGPDEFVQNHRNTDGLKGAAANTLRYAIANLSTGIEPWLKPDTITPWWEQRCRSLLDTLGLKDVGYRRDYDDARLVFNRIGWDAASDFGPLGTFSLAIALLALCWWRITEPWWRLAFVASILLGVVAYTVAWMPWNNRFLLAPFSLLAVALVSLAWRLGWRGLQWGLLGISFYSVIMYPLTSFNKRPSDLVAAVSQRESQEFKERPTLLPVVASVRKWLKQHPKGEVLLFAGSDSWVLPFLSKADLRTRPSTQARLAADLAANLATNRPTAVLVLNRPEFIRSGLSLRRLEHFPSEAGTALYGLDSLDPKRPRLIWEKGNYDDGWIAPQAVLALENWLADTVSLELWNATPLARSVEFSSSVEPNPAKVELAPGVKQTISIRVERSDFVSLRITPAYFSGNPADPRQLGVRALALSPDQFP